MTLTPINNGDLADATVVYGNFQYLDGRITATNTALATTQSNVQSTIDTTLSIYQDVNTLATSGEITLTANSVNKITPTGNVTFVLPTITDNTKFYQILVQIDMSDTLYDIDLGASWSFNNQSLLISSTGKYNIIYEYDGANWVCGILTKSEDA